MAFIILSDRHGEFDRRELHDALTIGRSLDCELAVRDVLLSRRHCRVEPHGARWVLIDLDSKNGTRLGEEPVTRHILEDGDTVRLGHTTICFRDGPFVATAPRQRRAGVRPLDPYDAMSSTVAGIEVADMEEDSRVSGFPIPKPKPAEPRGYHEEGVGLLVASLASGVWDSRVVVELPRRRASRSLPRPVGGVWLTPSAQSQRPLRPAIGAAPRQILGMPVAKAAAPAGHAIVAAEPRQAPAAEPLPRPRRWVVLTYLGFAGSVFATSICAISWQYLWF
jgi:hypothetical protein